MRSPATAGSRPRPRRSFSVVPALALASVVWAASSAGCGEHDAPPPPPPVAVTVSEPMVKEVIDWDTYVGRLDAVESVQVKARVSGLLIDVEAPDGFRDAQIVEKGQVLFKIDPRPYQAEFDRAAAVVKDAEYALANANIEFERIQKTAESGAASPIEFENKRLKQGQATSTLAGAVAAREAARLNLEFTTVKAPIRGRIGRHLVTSGNLVNGGQGEATLLTTIESVDPIYCYVDADEAAIQKYSRLAAENKRVSARNQPIPCFLSLQGEDAFSHEGYVDFVNNRLDPGTGTLRARGIFPNPDDRLLPGFFARVSVPGSGRYMATLIPDAAIGTDQSQKFVLVVNGDTAERRVVKIGSLFGTLRAIDEGVGPHDKVIVNGLMRVRPGAKVTAQVAPIPPTAFKGRAPGNPSTQALPTTRHPTGTGPATAPAAIVPATTAPPATTPTTQPTTGEVAK